jgi:transketolase
MNFPMDFKAYHALSFPLEQEELDTQQLKQLQKNIQFCRDVLIFFTAIAEAKGLGGHTGGAYDIVPEMLIVDGFMKGSDRILPLYFDEAGHRVALQYLMAVLNGELEANRLLHYREFDSKLPGHPERHFTPGIHFSSGRLGHLWSYVNGVALAHPDKIVFLWGSDGSQQEGNNAEAARMAVAQQLSVKLIIDDNDVTIAGHPSIYMPGFQIAKTLQGHGLFVDEGDGEALASLYQRIHKALHRLGPVALVNKRKMAVGIPCLEGTPHAHDVIKASQAIEYLEKRGYTEAVQTLKTTKSTKKSFSFQGSSLHYDKNREVFGKVLAQILSTLSPEERLARVRVLDSDLSGSCGLALIQKQFPEIYIASGIMERNNYAAAAGFGSSPETQGIFATFSAFLEMLLSEITMARLNESNVLAHFSHAGVDDSLKEQAPTALYFPADPLQMKAVLESVFWEKGLRFIFSTRSAVPEILKEDGTPFFGKGYTFEKGKDEVIREGSAGYFISYGEMLYRTLDAVDRLRQSGIPVGLINKVSLTACDENTLRRVGTSPLAFVIESQNHFTGLGIRYGSWLLERGYPPQYRYLGSARLGNGGLWEQIPHQNLDPDSLIHYFKTQFRR